MPDKKNSVEDVPVVTSTVRKNEVWREAERENAPYVAVEEGEEGYMPVYDMLTSHYRLTDETTEELDHLFRVWARDCTSEYILTAGSERGSLISLEFDRAVSVASKVFQIVKNDENLKPALN